MPVMNDAIINVEERVIGMPSSNFGPLRSFYLKAFQKYMNPSLLLSAKSK